MRIGEKALAGDVPSNAGLGSAAPRGTDRVLRLEALGGGERMDRSGSGASEVRSEVGNDEFKRAGVSGQQRDQARLHSRCHYASQISMFLRRPPSAIGRIGRAAQGGVAPSPAAHLQAEPNAKCASQRASDLPIYAVSIVHLAELTGRQIGGKSSM